MADFSYTRKNKLQLLIQHEAKYVKMLEFGLSVLPALEDTFQC